jgi:hypothetical protein
LYNCCIGVVNLTFSINDTMMLVLEAFRNHRHTSIYFYKNNSTYTESHVTYAGKINSTFFLWLAPWQRPLAKTLVKPICTYCYKGNSSASFALYD